MKHNIYITGFMGTGKTTVGKLLAEKLDKIFIDMDTAIQDRLGKSIKDIFKFGGEGYFRKLETNLLKEITQRNDLIVATGGGALLSKENIRLAEQGGKIICLSASPLVIFRRLEQENKRPLLLKGKKMDAIKELLEKRNQYYHQFAWQIDTSELSVEEVVDRIIKMLEKKDCLWKIS